MLAVEGGRWISPEPCLDPRFGPRPPPIRRTDVLDGVGEDVAASQDPLLVPTAAEKTYIRASDGNRGARWRPF